jgi:uncharacterized protein YecA (UPF0149 family)
MVSNPNVETSAMSSETKTPETAAPHRVDEDTCGCGHDHHHEPHGHDHHHRHGIEPYVRAAPKVGRNDPCPCGSGKKYKKCCLATA